MTEEKLKEEWAIPKRTIPIMPIVIGVLMIGFIIRFWYQSDVTWEENLECASKCEPYSGVVENLRCYCDQTKKAPAE